MDLLQRSCDASQSYPLNLANSNTAPYHLHDKRDLLRQISTRTFADEKDATVDFWECRQNGFLHTTVNSWQCLRDHLNLANHTLDCASLYRFVFVQASSSRTRLLLSVAMFKDLLTYFQVAHFIVPLVSLFGRDAGKQFQHCQFEAETRLGPKERGLCVPELKRSGQMIEAAYVFRTIEASTSSQGVPWQIKQTCVYHSFDVKTGLNTWLVIKGSDLVKRRVMREMSLPTADSSTSEAFLFSLDVQLMLADLSLENWRAYISELEQRFQSVTRAVTFKPVQAPRTLLPLQSIPPPDQLSTLNLVGRSRTFAYSQLSRSNTIKSWMGRMHISDPTANINMTNSSTDNTQGVPNTAGSVREVIQAEADEESQYFACLQAIKELEERALESLLVLKSTFRIWSQLQTTYKEWVSDEHFPDDIRKTCGRGFKRFENRLENIQDALQHETLRVECLINLLSGRKALLHSILEWRSMTAGNDVAVQATKSSIKMEEMTCRMQEIADRTERETVSMRIITLVTMFFLPGTFISTLMSTDIIKFNDNHQVYSSSAMRLFLAISLPMMGITFFAWYVVYWFTEHRGKIQRAKQRLSMISKV